jgi:raffinose/stachyose/melibiose transport system substrate-binding protein
VDYFVNFDNQQLMLTGAGRIPVFAEVVTPELASEELFAAVQDLNTADGTVLWLDTVLEASVADTYLNVIQEVLAGTKTPEEAAADVRQAALRAKRALGL